MVAVKITCTVPAQEGDDERYFKQTGSFRRLGETLERRETRVVVLSPHSGIRRQERVIRCPNCDRELNFVIRSILYMRMWSYFWFALALLFLFMGLGIPKETEDPWIGFAGCVIFAALGMVAHTGAFQEVAVLRGGYDKTTGYHSAQSDTLRKWDI